jgi:hypothetical protein
LLTAFDFLLTVGSCRCSLLQHSCGHQQRQVSWWVLSG